MEEKEWDRLYGIFSRDTALLKRELSSILNNPETTKENIVTISQGIMNTCHDRVSDEAFRLSVLRYVFQCAPKFVFGKLNLSSQLIDWVTHILDSDTTSCLPSLRGLALSISANIIRYFSQSTPQIIKFAKGLHNCLTICLENFQNPSLNNINTSSASPASNAIILHQCAEFLSHVRDINEEWLQPLLCNIPIVSKLVKLCCIDNLSDISQLQVDVIKVFGAIYELYSGVDKSNERLSVVQKVDDLDVVIALDCIVSCICSCSILHDSFTNAFRAGVDSLSSNGSSDKEEDLSKAVISLLDRIVDEIDSKPVDTIMNMKRIEALVINIGHLFGSEYLKTLVTSEEAMTDKVNRTINSIISLQERMRETLFHCKTQSNTNESIKDLKICCSDIRKASITSINFILKNSPMWVIENKDRYWDICIKKLGTPKLFAAGCSALLSLNNLNLNLKNKSQRNCENEKECENESGRESESEIIFQSILKFIESSLLNIQRYSGSAASDILQAVCDLYIQNCRNVIYSANCRIPMLLFEAYSKSPKFLKSESNDKGDDDNKEINDYLDWKSAVVDTLKLILLNSLEMAKEFTICPSDMSPSSILFQDDFKVDYLQVLVDDILLCHRVLGNTPGPKGLGASGPLFKANSKEAKGKFGTTEPEKISVLLLSLSNALASFLDVHLDLVKLVENSSSSSYDSQMSCSVSPTCLMLESLLEYLECIVEREVVFQDDVEQLLHDKVIVAKGFAYLWLTYDGDVPVIEKEDKRKRFLKTCLFAMNLIESENDVIRVGETDETIPVVVSDEVCQLNEELLSKIRAL